MLALSATFLMQLALMRVARAADDDDPLQIQTRVTWWSKKGCADNLGDDSVMTEDFDIYANEISTENPEDEDLACRVVSLNMPGWSTGDDDSYEAWLDTSGIEDGCKLLIYERDTGIDETEPRDCITNYDRLTNDNTCISLSVPKHFSYSYCCGDACGVRDSDDIFVNMGGNEKRDVDPASLRTVDEVFTDAKARRDPGDIVAAKRTPALDLLDRREDDDPDACKFEGNDGKTYEKLMGEQLRISRLENCRASATEPCSIEWSYSYSHMVGESFGVSASMGFNLMEIISAGVEMSQTFEESETTQQTASGSTSVDPGFDGYIVWEPLLECAKGKLVGKKCDDKYTLEEEDEACFVIMKSGAPDGRYTGIRQN